jgi:hypothetical protein
LWSNWWNEDWQGKSKYSENTCPNATLSTTNPTRPEPGTNPGRRGGSPATNRLSYGAAMTRDLMDLLIITEEFKARFNITLSKVRMKFWWIQLIERS